MSKIFSLIDEPEEFWSFLNSAAVCIHLVGADGKILFANQKELEFMGYQAEDYIGKNISDFHIDQEVVKDILERLSKGETLLSYVARLQKGDGSTLYVSINSNVYSIENEFIHTRCFSTEINEIAWNALKNHNEGL